jgi:hypothetical protein
MDDDGSVTVGDRVRPDRERAGALGSGAVNINRRDAPLGT